MSSPRPRDLLRVTAFGIASLSIATGCQSKAQKQAELASRDVAKLEAIVSSRHVESLARALPAAATALGAKGTGASMDAAADIAALATAFDDLRNKSDDLRSAKRSYYALVDGNGVITRVDEPAWSIVGRRMSVGFPPVREALAAPAGVGVVAHGAGRFGGASEEALTFVDATPLRDSRGKIVGALVAAWEAHEAAEDLQRQIATEMAMSAAPSTRRTKIKERHKALLDAPELWVAIFRGANVYLQEGAPQPVQEAANGLSLEAKTATGAWSATFSVLNQTWGGAAKRLPSLGPDVGVAVFRHD